MLNKDFNAVVIAPDGSISTTRLTQNVAELQNLVGGYIERVVLRDSADLYCNEDGIRLGLEPNQLAQELVDDHKVHPIQGHILGTVVIVGSPDEEGDATPVPSWVHEYLTH